MSASDCSTAASLSPACHDDAIEDDVRIDGGHSHAVMDAHDPLVVRNQVHSIAAVSH